MSLELDYSRRGWDEEFPHEEPTLNGRPTALLFPNSGLGKTYAPGVMERLDNIVGMFDRERCVPATGTTGCEYWDLGSLAQKATEHPGLTLIDFSTAPEDLTQSIQICNEARVTRIDFVQALSELDLVAIYQRPVRMKDETIRRQADYAELRKEFADELSRRTLDSILKLRLTYGRHHLLTALTSASHEYFSKDASNPTFTLGDAESFCDVGAYIGTTAVRVLDATGGQIKSLVAFEPDRASFNVMNANPRLRGPEIDLRNVAVGDYSGQIRFMETGTMGSRIDELTRGAPTIPVVRLDDVIERTTFIKMDLEGFEERALRGATRIVNGCRPRIAVTVYHYTNDLLDIFARLQRIAPDYKYRLRHHSTFYWDTVLYAEPAAALN